MGVVRIVLLVAAISGVGLLSVNYYWRQLVALEKAAEARQAAPQCVGHLQALADTQEALNLAKQAQDLLAARADEADEARNEAVAHLAAVQAGTNGSEWSAPSPSLKAPIFAIACIPKTFYNPPDEPLSEMAFVRDYLVHLGWKQAPDAESAAFVLAVGETPPVKKPCGEGFEGTRIPGTFARELEVCQKHKLFVRLADRLKVPGAKPVGPADLVATFPWLPKTYLLDRDDHVSALNASLPCEGSQASFIVKGDAHGGRAVWLPPTSEELRSLVGLPCYSRPANGDLPTASPEHPPRLVQEVLKSVLWGGASVMGRVFMVVQRRGNTRLSVERGRWSLGLPTGAPSYDLHMYDSPLFTVYPGQVRDSAVEETVIRRNGSEFETFLEKESKRRGQTLPSNWIQTSFMDQVGEIGAQAFAASATPWSWEMGNAVYGSDGADAVKATAMEPDGAFLFTAAEVLVDENLNVRLIEFTCVPADIHGLSDHFEELPWTKAFAVDLGKELSLLLLQNSGQDSDGERTTGRWKKLGTRPPFPHP